jgi:hypothetical protein
VNLTEYVRSAAGLLGVPLTEAQLERIAVHLERTRAMAVMLQAVPLGVDDEPAEIFKPAPFPMDGA